MQLVPPTCMIGMVALSATKPMHQVPPDLRPALLMANGEDVARLVGPDGCIPVGMPLANPAQGWQDRVAVWAPVDPKEVCL